MIKYVKGSLFDAPLGSTLVHAVNCRGHFRSGIAATIKDLYPDVFARYSDFCELRPELLIGTCLLANSSQKYEYMFANLFTSVEESSNKDPEEAILLNTVLAIQDLFNKYHTKTISSCKINAGHFGVPWEKTEFIIKTLSERHGVEWTVYDPKLGE